VHDDYNDAGAAPLSFGVRESGMVRNRTRVWWAILIAGIGGVTAHALPLPSSGVRRIAEDEWRAVLTEVQGTSAVDCQIIGSTRVYVCAKHREGIIWTFAMEGDPAFPAVSQSIVRPRLFCEPGYHGPKATISRSAEYAGDRTAFQKFYDHLIAVDKRFLAKQPQCGSQEKR
jgi:hypothetical protein